jgi:hypothetical protein
MAQAYTPPTDYKSGLEQVLTEAGNIYQQKKAAGYPTYTGQQIAGFAPEELAAMQGISSLVGAGQSYFTPAAQMLQGTARQFTPTEAATYMSPYQQAVVDVEKREAARAFAPQMQNIGAQAARAGSFGGSRQAILESEAMRNQQQMLADIQTRGSQRAYDTAQRAFESQLQRERQAASGLTSLGQVAPRQALAELTALSGIGEAQRGMTQAGLDIAKQQFERQQQYPYDLLGQYQSTLYGYPYQAFQQFQPVAKPSSAQNLAGVLGAVGKIGGSFGLFKEGGHVAFRSQGGLSGMAQKLAEGSTVGSSKDITKEGLVKSLLGLQTGLSDYQTAMKEALEEKERLTKERQEKLKKQTSPINYVSDLLLGYASADPEGSTGSQLAAAAEYADAQKQAVQSELDQLAADVASGKLTQAEAALKMQQLQATTLSDIIKATGGSTLESSDINALSRLAATATGADYDVRTGIISGTADQKAAQVELLNKMARAYESGGYYDALAIADAYGKSSTAPAGVTGTTKTDVTETETGKKADELIQGLKDK